MNKQNTEEKLVAVVVLNWNGKKYNDLCLQSLLNQSYQNFKIVFVDSASTDDSFQLIKEYYKSNPKFEFIALDKNLGFAGGNNKGIEYGIEKLGAEFVVTLNNDTKVDSNWLTNLIKGFDSDEIGVVSSNIYLYHPFVLFNLRSEKELKIEEIRLNDTKYKTLLYEGDKQARIINKNEKIDAVTKYKIALPISDIRDENYVNLKTDHDLFKLKLGQRIIKDGDSLTRDEVLNNLYEVVQNVGTSLNKKYLYFYEDDFFKPVKKEGQNPPVLESKLTEALCGCSMAIRSDLIKKFGAFEENFFMYYEDVELSLRIRKAGYKIKFVGDSIVYHYFWGSTDTISPIKIYYGVRNRLIVIKKYFGYPKFLYFSARNFAKGVTYFLKSDKIQYLNYFKAIRDAFRY